MNRRVWHWDIGVLGRCHLAVLVAIAVYLSFAYPAGILAITALLVAAVVSEAMPAPWRRYLAGEILLVIAGAASWFFLVRNNGPTLDGWLRMLIAYWLLVPSRPGLLRWTVSLTLAEALLLGSGRLAVHDWHFGRTVFDTPAVLAQPLLGLIPIALLTLGLDAWASARLGARGRRVSRAAWRFAVVPGAIITVIALSLAPITLPHHLRLAPRIDNGQAVSGIQRPMISPGEHQWVQRDPSPKARLLWENPDEPFITGAAYLRVFTLPRVTLVDNLVRWEAAPLDQLRRHSGGFDERKPFAWIVRLPMGNDAVLRCEPGYGVEINDLLGDRSGNRYSAGFDASPRAYRVNVDDAPPDLGLIPEQYMGMPDDLASLPWDSLIDPTWRDLSVEELGPRISDMLGKLCHYDLKDLPKPASRPGGIMLTFLWSDDPADRRGHCQYFATAAALLLRHLGHPTRCCSGYTSNEFDAEGYTFRGLNAHAWLEVLNEQGTWLRVDPTPAGHLEYRETYGELPSEIAPKQVEQPWRKAIADAEQARRDEISSRSRYLPFIGSGLIVVLLIAWWFQRRRRNPVIRDPLQARLDREAATLERLAADMGIHVTPATTLSDLAQALGHRTGIDLSGTLRAHLAARYGGGPPPPPWPIDDLRAAARKHSEART